MNAPIQKPTDETFVEAALKLSGKSDEEARRTGDVDRADEQVEAMFSPKYQTSGSPIHQAVWDADVPMDMFTPDPAEAPKAAKKVMEDSLEIMRRRKKDNRILNSENKVSNATMTELGKAGYWGLLIDKKYGGSGSPFAPFAKFLTTMATIDPTVAGLASVHGCIGAVDPIIAFGNEQQKSQYLPLLASGKRTSGFALTEPCAGSDLTALRTTAVLKGDNYVVNGEKLFITNAVPGRTVGLVCLIDGKPAVLIADLPKQENKNFKLVRYGIHALKHTHNNGLKFKNFRVPKENLLKPPAGDGLTIAYHGLNRGRVALCANAAGTMRMMMANMLPWARFRKTYGDQVAKRELAKRRVGHLAGLIVAADAMAEWGGWLLDEGFRGEMECIIAKIFGSESQKEAAIELFMKTHGGRSFLHGHLLGDHVHEFLAPCIYEGEGEMLGMAFFKSLVKMHGKQFFEPIGRALADAGIKKPNPMNPSHMWTLRKVATPYLKWQLDQRLDGRHTPQVPNIPSQLREHASYAAQKLQNSRFEIDGLMRKHELKLPDRQCAIAELSQRIQDMVVMLVTAMSASQKADTLTHDAADVMCRHLRQKLDGKRPSGSYFRAVNRLGEAIADGGFHAITGIEPEEIMMSYSQD